MTTFQLVPAPEGQRTSQDLIESGDADKMMKTLKANPDDDTIFPRLMSEYHCTHTTMLMLIISDVLITKED